MKEEAITAIYYAALLYESPSHGNDIFPLITKLLDEGLSFFYPFFVRSVRNMSKDDYDKNSKTIVNYLIPGKCHDPDNFYYWILLIAEQSIELRTSSIDFGEIIGQLICKDFSAKKFDSLDQLMNLIILFNHELETDLTPIGTSTIEYLFAYIKRKKEKGAEILTPIFCSCFTLFFFSPNPKSEPPEDNVFTQYSDHFCFFTKKLKFDCILNQQIPQSFISIARTFIKYQAKKPFNIQLAENAPLISYVELQAFTLLKLQNCGESLTDFNKKCISVLKKQSKTEVVLGLLKSINDSNASSIKCDNAEQILNTFESTLQNICTFSYTTQLQANCDNFIQQFMTKIVKSLDFTLTSLPAPESSSMEYFISAVNSSSLKKLLLMYKKYRQNITDKYNTTQAINEKILTVFNRELGTQCGPWYHSDSQNGKHFKSAKTFVSPYSLSNMKINPKFDIIKPCSSIEDRLRPLPVNPDKTIYNAKLITLRFVFTGIIHSMPNGLVFTGEYTNIKKRRLDILSKEIIYIFTRTMINGAEGCEIFLNNSKAYLFEFPPGVRDNLFKFIEENYKIKRYAFFGTKYNFFSSIVKASGGVIQKVSSDELYTQSKLSEAWETRKITTFTYLYYLNILAGRSFNDLCKYPIFPWVISDYNADELDILKMEIFRDLTRPIPFLKASRTDPKQSIHISNSNIVLNYLQRLEPYSSIRSNFQIDQSKCPPFDSILDTWNSIMNCPNDNRELIPEFYCNPLIFKSEKGDVALPKWAKNSPYIFVKGNRAALESEIVRKSLHKWIDMIFGIHLNALDVVANNPDLKPAYFGVLPQQILLQPQHPSCEPISYQFDENYKLPIKKVHRIRQGIVLTDDFKIVTSDGTKIKSPRITNLKFFEVSKQAKIAFYGSSFESYVNAVFFKDQEHVIMSHEAALVNSIAVVGLYLVTGTVEGTINRWRLPKLKTFPLLKTNFHRCPVVAIGGSVSMNTIVSLDIEGRLVYETLLYHGFLLTVKLKHSFPTNYIVVYKSGNVIVIQSSKNKSIISVLDMTGNIIKVREYSAFIQEYDKMYSTEKSDLLIIGYNSDTVEILDIPSLITIREYHGMIPNMRFSKAGKSKKHIKAFIASEIAILPMDVATKKI